MCRRAGGSGAHDKSRFRVLRGARGALLFEESARSCSLDREIGFSFQGLFSNVLGSPDAPMNRRVRKVEKAPRAPVYATPSGADASVVSWRTRRPRCMSVRVPAKLSDSRRSSRTRRASHLQLPLSSPRRAGGLDEQVTDAVLHAAFVPFGDVKEVNIPLEQTTQKNRGFAFVTFVETCVRGRPTTRTRSRRARSRPRDEPASLLRATRSGLTVSFAKSFLSLGQKRENTRDDAAAAMDNMHNSELFGRTIRCNYAQPPKIKGGDAGFASQPVWADADQYAAERDAEEAERDESEDAKKSEGTEANVD